MTTESHPVHPVDYSPAERGPQRNLVVFLPTGKTFSFKYVRNFISNESVITFDYIAMSDGKHKSARFYVNNIAGFGDTYL
jgi:hypothetical protein